MSSIYKRGNIWYYEVCVDNKRYQGSTRTSDKKTAQQIADGIIFLIFAFPEDI